MPAPPGGDARAARQFRKATRQLGQEAERDLPLSRVGPEQHHSGAEGGEPGRHVVQQPGLPQSCGGGDVQVPGTGARALPPAHDGGELPLPPDQLGDQTRRILRRRLALIGTPLAGQEDPGRGLRRPAQGRHPFRELIGFDGERQAVLALLDGLEQQAPGALACRVGIAGAAGQLLGFPHPPRIQPLPRNGLGGAQEDGPQPLPLDIRPVLELDATRGREAPQEIPLVELGGPQQVPPFNRRQEFDPIHRNGREQREFASPAGQGIGAEQLPQVPDGLAQGVTPAVGLEVGPEQVHQVLAGGALPWGTGQVREERQRLARTEQLAQSVGAEHAGLAQGAQQRGLGTARLGGFGGAGWWHVGAGRPGGRTPAVGRGRSTYRPVRQPARSELAR